MKKRLLLTILLLAIIFVGWRLADLRKPLPDIQEENVGRYGISEQVNRKNTGSAVCFYLNYDDDWYLFVRDFKHNPAEPQFLCYMNYTSTQGSYEEKWSKDEQMIAVYNESSDHFPDLKLDKWVVGYDWKTGRVLHSNQIPQRFKQHSGIGAEFVFPTLRKPTPQELQQFQAESLSRDKRIP